MVGVVGAGAVDVPGIEHGRQEPGARERHAFGAPLAGRDALRRLSEEPPLASPIFEDAEHARVRGDAGALRRIVDGVADQHARARGSAGLIAQ